MQGPTPQDEPYIDEHPPNPSEVRDDLEDHLREGTRGWYPEDADDHAPIWRYMDLGKFISLIQTTQLWFSHSSKFKDPYEGRYSKSVAEDIQREKWGIEEPNHDDTEFFIDDEDDDYVSCWNLKESQSVALWEMYVEGKDGVAVKSTVRSLNESIVPLPDSAFDHRIESGKVKYHITGEEPRGAYAPIYTKRDIFDFEEEYRIVLTSFESLEDAEIDGVRIEPNVGIGLEIDPSILIDEVYVSPGAGEYLEDVIEGLRSDYGPDFSIEKSTVFDHPLVDS